MDCMLTDNRVKNSKGIHFIENLLRRLSLKTTHKKGRYLKSWHKFDIRTGRTHQKRSDRRRNVISILRVMISELELSTMCWGMFFTNHKGETDLYTRGIDYLVEKTGLQEKTVCRALGDLQASGYLEVERREAIGKKGKEMRIYSLRRLTNKFLIEMGMRLHTIKETVHWKERKNEKKYYSQKMSTICRQGLNKLGLIFKQCASVQHKHKHKNKPIKNAFSMKPTVKQLSPERTSNLIHQAHDIAVRTGRSATDVYKELLSKL